MPVREPCSACSISGRTGSDGAGQRNERRIYADCGRAGQRSCDGTDIEGLQKHHVRPYLQRQSAIGGGCLAVLAYIENHQLVEAAKAKGSYLLARLRQMAEQCEMIGDVRGKGLLLAIEFVAGRTSKLPFPSGLGITSRIIDKAFQKGLLVYPAAGGVDGIGDAIIVGSAAHYYGSRNRPARAASRRNGSRSHAGG